jgi:hypothetical protein
MDKITPPPLVYTEFHKFGKLPVELRFEIWEMALQQLTRNVQFNWYYKMELGPFGVLRRHLQPPLLSTCHESRILALKYYEKWMVCEECTGCPASKMRHELADDDDYQSHLDKIPPESLPECLCFHPYVNFDSDTFVLWGSKVGCTVVAWSKEVDKIKHVGVLGWEKDDMVSFLEEKFSRLETVTVVLNWPLERALSGGKRTGSPTSIGGFGASVRASVKCLKDLMNEVNLKEGWKVPRVFLVDDDGDDDDNNVQTAKTGC